MSKLILRLHNYNIKSKSHDYKTKLGLCNCYVTIALQQARQILVSFLCLIVLLYFLIILLPIIRHYIISLFFLIKEKILGFANSKNSRK